MCYRIPMVVPLPSGTLLAFVEARQWIGDGCYPHGSTINDTTADLVWNTSIVMRSSTE